MLKVAILILIFGKNNVAGNINEDYGDGSSDPNMETSNIYFKDYGNINYMMNDQDEDDLVDLFYIFSDQHLKPYNEEKETQKPTTKATLIVPTNEDAERSPQGNSFQIFILSIIGTFFLYMFYVYEWKKQKDKSYTRKT